MTETPIVIEEVEVDDGPVRPAWEIPEMMIVALVASIGVLIVGGLAAGIARIVSDATEVPFGGGLQEIWSAVAFGAEWANFVVAAILLAALGLCWWQLQGWAEVTEEADDADDGAEAFGHIHRALLLTNVVVGGLGLTAVGALAGVVAELGEGNGQSFVPVDIYAGAEFVAVAALFTTGALVARRLRRGYAGSGTS
jgi:hypothetical protein